MKHQNSTSNTQRSINNQPSKPKRKAANLIYPESLSRPYALNEGASDGREMKHQNPTTNTQRTTKNQSSKPERKASKFTYPEPLSHSCVFKEDPNGTNHGRHAFDLEERTAKFCEEIIRFSKKVPHSPENNRLIDQVVGAGTSVGANYAEATESISKKDFRCSISRCVKEAKETKHFLRMIAASEPGLAPKARELYREGNELHMNFASIFRKAQ